MRRIHLVRLADLSFGPLPRPLSRTVVDQRIRTSAACALCHSNGERVVGKQTQTFLEWREDFNKPGLGQQQCQDCHMPKTTRKLAEDFPVPERVVARRLWTGGHSFKRVAAALDLSIAQLSEGQPQFALHVANVGAGHSVPTGSNRRAVYLDAEVLNATGKVVARNSWMFAPWMLARPDESPPFRSSAMNFFSLGVADSALDRLRAGTCRSPSPVGGQVPTHKSQSMIEIRRHKTGRSRWPTFGRAEHRHRTCAGCP